MNRLKVLLLHISIHSHDSVGKDGLEGWACAMNSGDRRTMLEVKIHEHQTDRQM
jgi:hypothetical protein